MIWFSLSNSKTVKSAFLNYKHGRLRSRDKQQQKQNKTQNKTNKTSKTKRNENRTEKKKRKRKKKNTTNREKKEEKKRKTVRAGPAKPLSERFHGHLAFKFTHVDMKLCECVVVHAIRNTFRASLICFSCFCPRNITNLTTRKIQKRPYLS